MLVVRVSLPAASTVLPSGGAARPSCDCTGGPGTAAWSAARGSTEGKDRYLLIWPQLKYKVVCMS